MGRVLPRTCALLAAGALVFPLISSSTTASAATTVTITPVEVLPQDPFANPVPLSHADAYALEKMQERAQANPGVYAVPYVANGTLYSPVVNPAEQAAAETLSVPPPPAVDDGTDDTTAVPPPDEGGKPAEPPPAAAASELRTPGSQVAPQAVPPRVNLWIEAPLVQYSLSRLEEIKDEVLELTPDVLPGAEHLISATVEPEQNRVVVGASAAPDTLRTALATRYGIDAVAILVTDAPRPQPLSREFDTSPFYGGAKTYPSIGGMCTNGFSWAVGGVSHMLTAGHCTSMGGYVNVPPTNRVGTVVKDNWGNSTGTVKIDGQTQYRGDLSLIKVVSPKTSVGRIYVGNHASSASRAVAGMASRWARRGDKFCSGGWRSGEICGWTVAAIGVDVRYNDGTLLRNAVFASKRGACMGVSDSGGPAYTVNSAGKVVARGIISGGGGDGSAARPCLGYFTDIRHADAALPGSLKTG
ncbi:hypothetical protein [Rhizohabitans arisaemae]|uniref:hypothetical protein n=1 Tax=Rhizohabitans arisaemae TaxID=2720610 RepID=UPI0024B0D1F2|nr:hypothetical protein [Rhizohabitans arisaemae]